MSEGPGSLQSSHQEDHMHKNNKWVQVQRPTWNSLSLPLTTLDLEWKWWSATSRSFLRQAHITTDWLITNRRWRSVDWNICMYKRDLPLQNLQHKSFDRNRPKSPKVPLLSRTHIAHKSWRSLCPTDSGGLGLCELPVILQKRTVIALHITPN